ncbi:DUF421 domain-containing protein [Flavisolibacter ginsenosidimutans]|uniref:DUF421 domain-containing protein n=1 Tax=Flavisolibacter ginsenosidimutans TaxID=661481 RepID=A0A5B8UE22_9BACT|nr:YetF domain-containing protein [Flavisolibacter ginsenosidimutans]QEC54931.1 DUF421 domain-containing protein [Flavisolibacter ginsenosidimutans]
MDITQIWGNKADIGPLEIVARSAVMFVYMIILLRITGMRTFGKGDVFDDILTILYGAVLARGIVGATPFVSAMASGAALVCLHFVFSKLTYFNKGFGRLIKGKPFLLYKNGRFERRNMEKSNISEHDIMEELRINVQKDSLTDIEEVRLERTGEVSFVKKT